MESMKAVRIDSSGGPDVLRAEDAPPSTRARPTIKCVVWDLDNTIWNGVLVESTEVELREQIPLVLRTLDERGIVQSIASRNDRDNALAKLKEFGIDEYFLCPRIDWGSKADSIGAIVKTLNIGMDAVAFIDDSAFERDEVRFVFPEVLCIDALEVDDLLGRPEFSPLHVTAEARQRRCMYRSEFARQEEERTFPGSKEDFLRTLGMVLTIRPVVSGDLQRCQELTERTHQLNSTGHVYSVADLEALLDSPMHQVLVASLEDRYGSYGQSGLAVVEQETEFWTLKLLLVSCRVISRGVGTILLNQLIRDAGANGVRLRAEFIANDRNRITYAMFKFNGFKILNKRGEFELLENDCSAFQPEPNYVEVRYWANHERREPVIQTPKWTGDLPPQQGGNGRISS